MQSHRESSSLDRQNLLEVYTRFAGLVISLVALFPTKLHKSPPAIVLGLQDWGANGVDMPSSVICRCHRQGCIGDNLSSSTILDIGVERQSEETGGKEGAHKLEV